MKWQKHYIQYLIYLLLKLFQLCPLGPLSVVSWAPLTNSSKCQFLHFGFVFFWLFTSLYSEGSWIFDRTSKHKEESLAFNEQTLEHKSQVTELDHFYFEIQHLVKNDFIHLLNINCLIYVACRCSGNWAFRVSSHRTDKGWLSSELLLSMLENCLFSTRT